MSKIMSLKECVKQTITHGCSLHFSFTHNRPMAFAWEILRQFKEKKLALHLVGTGMLEYAVALVWGGQVQKLEGAFFGETYPAPRPNKLMKNMAREGLLEMEYWTNLTIPQRFMAASYGLDYIPTNSLKDSSLLEEHLATGKAFIVEDPLTNQETVMIRALQPDVTVVHASLADQEGNAVITPPYGEDLWGVHAAKTVIVVAEKIVDKNTIQSLSHLVKIPAHIVDYVIEVPFAAHPYGTSPIGYSDFSYGEDYEFRTEFSAAIEQNMHLSSWMKKWKLDEGHEEFLETLGTDRISRLKAAVKGREVHTTKTEQKTFATEAEKLIISASRIIVEKIKQQQIKTILAGIGVSHLTAWLVYKKLQQEGLSLQLMTETGYYGYDPIEGDPYIFNFGNLFTNVKQSSFIEILGQFVGDQRNPCLAILSAAQVDENGNLNSTKIPEKNLFLTGSGGANDIASVSADVVVMMNGDRKKFTKKVPYITSTGKRVSTIFTNAAVLARENEQTSFKVSHWIQDEKKKTISEYQQSLQDLVPWDIEESHTSVILAEPTKEELQMLRKLDPDGVFLHDVL